MRVKWVPEAKESLFEVTEYIRKENPETAKRVITQIHKSTALLSQNPYLAPPSQKFPDYRELFISRYPFVVWYRVEDDKQVIEIRLVWHTSQHRGVY